MEPKVFGLNLNLFLGLFIATLIAIYFIIEQIKKRTIKKN